MLTCQPPNLSGLGSASLKVVDLYPEILGFLAVSILIAIASTVILIAQKTPNVKIPKILAGLTLIGYLAVVVSNNFLCPSHYKDDVLFTSALGSPLIILMVFWVVVSLRSTKFFRITAHIATLIIPIIFVNIMRMPI